VLIIGAGVSGLAAARSLSRHGLSVRVLEASSLIGGRVRTLHVPGWPRPVELGAEFVHGRPTTTLSLAQAEGLELSKIRDVHALRQGERLVPMQDLWPRFAEALSPALERPHAWSVQKLLEQEKLAADQAELVRMLVEGFHAAPLNDVSARSLAEDASASAAEFQQYRLVGGYERLVKKLEHELSAESVELALGARVRRVAWQKGQVTLQVSLREQQLAMQASCCLVSVSVGVLQAKPEAGGIEFSPSLAERLPALNRLAMGSVVKVVLRLRHMPGLNARLPPAQPDFLHDSSSEIATIWLQTLGEQTQLTAWAGGPRATALSGLSSEELHARIFHAVARTLGLDEIELRRSVLASHAHDFNHDPLTLGAYSYVRPGGVHSARKLALPLANSLFFCGEALDLAYPGTVAGALGSGEHAARQILVARRGRTVRAVTR
jgi:monoamine oxidase